MAEAGLQNERGGLVESAKRAGQGEGARVQSSITNDERPCSHLVSPRYWPGLTLFDSGLRPERGNYSQANEKSSFLLTAQQRGFVRACSAAWRRFNIFVEARVLDLWHHYALPRSGLPEPAKQDPVVHPGGKGAKGALPWQ